jgi:hypothetical protein
MVTSDKPPGDRLVDVVVTQDHVAVMDPAVPILEPVLHYRRKSYTAGGPLGYQEVEEDVDLFEVDIKGRVCFPAGLLFRVRRVLHEHGYRVRIKDQRVSGPRLQVDHDALDGADDGNKPLIRAIAREPLGRIEAHADEDAMEKMLLVARLFPDARVVVAVPTKKEAWKIWRGLEERLDGRVGLAVAGTHREGRWLVSTFGSVPRGMAYTYDILLLPHGEESTGEKACAMVAGMSFERVYAFVRPQRRPDMLAELRLEQMAGPVIHRAKKPRVPVRVMMLPTPDCEVASYQSALERKRTLYWRNKKRNEYVAEVAEAVYSRDHAALKRLGLRNKDIRVVKKCDPTKIKISVESPEHARELLSLMPEWRVGSLSKSAKEEGKEQACGVNLHAPMVMTAVYAATLEIQAEIIIHAAGTAWPLRVKNFPPKEDDKTPSEVLIIDFADGHQQDAVRRIKEYERLGMAVHTFKTQAP